MKTYSPVQVEMNETQLLSCFHCGEEIGYKHSPFKCGSGEDLGLDCFLNLQSPHLNLLWIQCAKKQLMYGIPLLGTGSHFQ